MAADIAAQAETSAEQLKVLLAERTGTRPEDWYAVLRARMGMQVVFETLRDLRGHGEVVTQLFTCVTATASITAAGMTPVFADILEDTLAADPEALPISEKTRAVLYQHTFGLFDSAREESVRDRAHAAGALYVEDCAHCVARMAKDGAGAPLADVSVHSLGIEKVASALFGGAIWVNPDMADEALRDEIRRRLAALPEPSAAIERAVASYSRRLRILSHLPVFIRKPLRARWTAKRAFLPGVTDEELRGRQGLEPMKPGREALARDLAELAELDANEAQRVAAHTRYIQLLSETGAPVRVPAAAMGEPQPLLWFPVIVDTAELADKILAAVMGMGYYCSSWGRPVLFAGVDDPSPFNFDGDLSPWPVTQRASRGIVCLPCSKTPEQVLEIVHKLIELASE